MASRGRGNDELQRGREGWGDGREGKYLSEVGLDVVRVQIDVHVVSHVEVCAGGAGGDGGDGGGRGRGRGDGNGNGSGGFRGGRFFRRAIAAVQFSRRRHR